VYPEHRDITILSVEDLDPARRAMFEGLWREARIGHEQRLCERAAEAEQRERPGCIDWAAMPAISGDHSCSSAEMLDIVSHQAWILTVADIAARLKIDLSEIDAEAGVAGTSPRFLESDAARARRVNALRAADLRLQRADPEYATRAGSNNAHFLLARPRPDYTAQEYMELSMRYGSEINAVGVFGWYHSSALQKATRLARETLVPEERSALARAMLADEAFALHFIEDVYAAGHVAGTWGRVSQRKGTHDYYNEHGLEAMIWNGGSAAVVLMGDAHMRPEDAQRAAEAVRMSLEELVDAATQRLGDALPPHTLEAPMEPDSFDVCKATALPRPTGPQALDSVLLGVEVLRSTPIPSLSEGSGAMPRFQAELGPFIGVAGALDARYVAGGFTELGSGNGFVAGADLSLRAGLGVNGVLDEAGDGLIYLSVGYRGDSQSTSQLSSAGATKRTT
jgi:hypothetical protein